MREKNVPGQFGVSRGSARRDRRRIEAVEAPARVAGAGQQRQWVLRVLDQLRRGPILKIEAGRRRVIPGSHTSSWSEAQIDH